MRRRQAAVVCPGASCSRWLTVLFLLCLLYCLSAARTLTAQNGANYALTVTNAESLREAFLNRNVSLIYLGQDISLTKKKWKDGKRTDPESAIVVARNVTLTTHPSLGTPAVLYLDYMKSRVLAGADIFLNINGVVMTGVSRHPLNYFFVPFFEFKTGGTVFIQNSQYQLLIDPITLWPLETYPLKMNTTNRPEGFEDWPVEARVISDKECWENTLREAPCEDGAIWIGTLAARLTLFDKEELPVGKAAFLAKNVLLTAKTFNHGDIVDYSAVNVSSAYELKKALQNPLISEIQIKKDLNLTEDLFGGTSRISIARNLTLSSDPALERVAAINFNYLRAGAIIEGTARVTLIDLNLTRVSLDPRSFELVPFFSLQAGATYMSKNVISEMAVSSTGHFSLNQLPYLLYEVDVPEVYGRTRNDVRVVGPKWCRGNGLTECPDGALWIIRGIRSLQILDAYNQEVLGTGFIDIQNTVIRAERVSSSDLLLGTNVDNGPENSPSRNRVSDQREKETKKQKSFGFIGGFDPWILIYALVVAALVLGCCLFVTIIRRRRENKIRGKASTIRSEESCLGEDDGMNVHQKIARQLLGDVKLGTLLGCGSFGRVYKAMWSGAQVAVKVILHQEDEAEVEQEAQFSISLRHPNVVQTFHYAVRTVETSTPTPKKDGNSQCVVNIRCKPPSSSSTPPVRPDNGMNLPQSWMKSTNGGDMFTGVGHSVDSFKSSAIPTEQQSQVTYQEERWLEMWLIQEFCNLGSLGKQNYLRVNDQPSAWGCRNPSMHIIIDTCKDISRGMKYLHDNGIVHGDLKCDNLLLQSSHVDRKGFTAKVADFGLSRKLGPSTHLSTKSFGTITHMPPELLLDGHLSSKVDVYSFGVIMWELVTGLTPYRDLRYAEVMRAIVVENKRPQFDHGTREDYVNLAKRCWDKNPTRRPAFGEVLEELDKMSLRVQSPSATDSVGSWDTESEDRYA